jgi:hypothetical protein
MTDLGALATGLGIPAVLGAFVWVVKYLITAQREDTRAERQAFREEMQADREAYRAEAAENREVLRQLAHIIGQCPYRSSDVYATGEGPALPKSALGTGAK